MNTIAPLFDVGDTLARPRREVASVVPVATADDVTSFAGVALWGPLLDRLGVVDEADRRLLRPVRAGGFTGGECYRAIIETQLAGGEFLSDVVLLGGATQRLRGEHRLPSHTTLFRFCDDADFGRAHKAAAVNRVMLGRAWAMGAGPTGGLVTVDPDATLVATYGPTKQASTFTYRRGLVGMSPLVGVCGETGDVLAVRARAGNAHPGRAMGSFITECVGAIPDPVRQASNLWVRVDSAGYQHDVFDTVERLGAVFTVTAPHKSTVKAAIHALASDPATVWTPALDAQSDHGSEIAETMFTFAHHDPKIRRRLRMIVRRQPTGGGDQLSFDDLDGYRYHAIVTNIPALLGPANMIEAHHRHRGGIPEDTIRQLKHDFGFNHAPCRNFYANWVWWHASALAHNVARWLETIGLPREFRRARGKRLRLAFFNVAARLVTHARQIWLRLPRHHAWADAFIEALTRIRQLPAYA